jgi:hypothetical protein
VCGDVESFRQRDQEIGHLLQVPGEGWEMLSRKRAGV